MKHALFSIVVALVLLSQASQLSAGSKDVVEADEKMIESCKFLGTVTKKAFIGTVKKARKNVMKEAGKLGATHVVFTETDSANAIEFASATGRAYECKGKKSDN